VRRVLETCMPMRVSVLSERRSRQPYGMYGGGDGASGRNTWIKRETAQQGSPSIKPDGAANRDAAPDEPLAPDMQVLGKGPEDLEFGDIPRSKGRETNIREINVGGKATLWMGTGDKLIIETPGGGGWGVPNHAAPADVSVQGKLPWEARGSVAERERIQEGF
jgi:N-methylhydantoinase B/oxoprolinase/acetone carboxylase alpha subunit